MPLTARTGLLTCGVAMMLATAITAAPAQDKPDAQRRLDRIQRELRSVAADRRRIQGERGDASRALRAADEQLGHSGRTLSETERQLLQQQTRLASLRQRRDTLQRSLGASREGLARLLRASYAVGRAAPLKAMLAQDRIADAARVLTLQRYLQRDRARRIATLTAQLQALDALEQQIAQTRRQLEGARALQRVQLAKLQADRLAQARTVAQLAQRDQNRAQREQALARDARGLEQVLAQLRAAAARAAERRASAARQARRRDAAGTRSTPPGRRPSPPLIASAAPLRVGGLGWPVDGALLARYGGALPGGGTSQGVLIGAAAGTPVRAVASGRVVFADWMNGYGLILIIDHGNGAMTLYAHNEALLRDVGDSVRRGDPVSSVGNSGAAGRPALYFELRRNGEPVDPTGWLQKR